MGCWLCLRGPEGCKRDGLRCTDVICGGDSCWRRSDGRARCDCGRTAAGALACAGGCMCAGGCGHPGSPSFSSGPCLACDGVWVGQASFVVPGGGGDHGCVPGPDRDMASNRSCRRPQHDAYVEIVCGAQRLEPLDMRAGRALSSEGAERLTHMRAGEHCQTTVHCDQYGRALSTLSSTRRARAYSAVLCNVTPDRCLGCRIITIGCESRLVL